MNDQYNREATELTHTHIFEALERIEKQTTITNGKVKRMTMGLIAVGAFSLGLGLVEARYVLNFLI